MDNSTQAEVSHGTLTVQVRYLGSHRPYVDPKAQATATAHSVKTAALAFFGLVDGGGQAGTKAYTLSKDTVAVTDLSATLEQLADGKHELKFDLIEQLEQG
jgi:hypothetical protein